MVIDNRGYTIQKVLEEYNSKAIKNNTLLKHLLHDTELNVGKIDEVIEHQRKSFFELIDILFGYSISDNPMVLTETKIGQYDDIRGVCINLTIYTFALL
jgi:DNA polymerase II small subunit/DNA polymerase delta subunit B